MQRVQGEEGRHGRALPEPACQPRKRQEKKQRVRHVQQQAHGVVPARPGTEELPVEHMGEPGERVPEIGIEVREGPADALGGDPGPHVGIFVYIERIVEVDKIEAHHGGIDRQRCRGKNQANIESPAL